MKPADQVQSRFTLSRYLIAAPVILLAGLFLVQLVGNLRIEYAPASLAVLNTLILPVGSVPLAVLAAFAIVRTGRAELAWLGAGVIALGLAIVAAQQIGTPISLDSAIKIQNLGVLLSGAFHLIGALSAFYLRGILPAARRRTDVLAAAYLGAVAAVTVVSVLTMAEWLPVFFIPGQGGTPLRNAVLTLAVVLLASASLLVLLAHERSRSPFLNLYGLGLALLALGQFAYLYSASRGDAYSWLGRIDQWSAAVYFITACGVLISQSRTDQAGFREVLERLFPSSAEGYRLLVQASADAVIGVDGQEKVLIWNHAAEKLFGLHAEETVGRPLIELTGVHLSGVQGEAPDGSAAAKPRQLFLRNQAGQGFWADLTVAAYGSSRNPISAVVIRDITERKRAEEALSRLNETLEQRVAERTAVAEQRARQLQALALQLTEAEERERRRIADLLHDDLQQLLSASRFQLSVIRPTLQDHASAELMLQQVDQLLEKSIAKSRRLSQDLSPAILFHSGLAAAVEWLAKQIQDRHGLAVTVESSGPGLLQNDLLQVFLFRCIQEMLFNVIKHAGVDCALVRLERLEDRVEVTVSDQGKGFDPQSLHSLELLSKSFGLFSIRERIGYIGGSLDIESAPGQGSCFLLSIPLELDQPKRLLPLHYAPEVLSRTVRSSAKKDVRYRILLADDHQLMRQGLIAVLESQPDIQVIGEASNGREAVELARRLDPDVVVMDVVMPEMDGFEATKIIKREMPWVRVVGLSMLGDEQVSERLKEAGAEAYINKGDVSEALIDAIRREKVDKE